jgi:dTDP-4-dehydrorhamnose 3,5-epimerase
MGSIPTMDLPHVIVPSRHVDDRGWLSETFSEARLQVIGILHHFVQENRSYSRCTGTLRGLHFQLPPLEQAKLISVLRGRIFDVAVDVRNGSPTFGRYVSIELSAESGQQLYVPAGFAHGFVTMENDVIVSYKVSNYYSPAYDGGIRWNDTKISIPWPIPETGAILSDRDKALPLLEEFVSPFPYDGKPLGPLVACILQ